MGVQRSGRFNKAKGRRNSHNKDRKKYERQKWRTDANKRRRALKRAKRLARLKAKRLARLS